MRFGATHASDDPGLVRFQAVVDSLSEGVVVRDADGRLLICNRAAEEIIGLSASDLADFPKLPDGWAVLDADGDPVRRGEHPAAVCMRTGEPVRDAVTVLRRPDGSELWLSVNAQPLPLEGLDEAPGVALSFTDVTETRRIETERRALERRLRRVTALRIAAAPAMVGAQDEVELLQRTCEIAVRDAGFLLAWIGVADEEAQLVRPAAASGATSYLDDVVVTLGDEDPRSHGPTGIAIRERRAIINREIATDPRMRPWRARALEYGFGASASFPLTWDGKRCALMVYAAEPDFFNDAEVHLLEQFVADLALALREAAGRRFLTTITANMGEGLVALDGDGRLTYVNEAALELLEWGRADVTGADVHDLLHPQDGRAVPCSPQTCGLLGAICAGTPIRTDDDFARSDGTLLAVSCTATPLGREAHAGTILVFGDATQRRLEAERMREELTRVTWIAQISDALASGGFELHAQPIIDVRSGETVQHELLIRMRGEDGALIAPADFLPTAESCGLMCEIDRWVIARAGELAAAGHAVEFNLSAASLADPDMLAFIETTLDGTACAGGRVVCEVTETAVVTDREGAERFLRRLEQLGIDVALDDFGSGYAGLSYYKTFPARYLKIDVEFIGDLAHHPASRHVVEAIVGLARAVGKLTVAEGVEDLEQLRLLADLGVDRAQGYAIARPAPAAEVLEVTRRRAHPREA